MNRDPQECKLCHRIALLRKSHILPEFFYEELYNEKAQIAQITTEYGGRQDYMRSGRWEYLLCDDCENFLNINYESYAATLYRERINPLIKSSGGLIIIENIDYEKFKLFLLSLLWRMGVSTDKLFRLVSLGSHEDKLRKMLLTKSPGEKHEYGVMMVNTRLKERMISDLITQAEVHHVEGNRAYSLVIAGIAYCFVVSKHSHLISQQGLFLEKNGLLPILSKDAAEIGWLSSLFSSAQTILDKNRRTDDSLI